MIEHNFTKPEQCLRQIADMLLLNGTLTECPGLIDGKMGIAVFFFHYAQYTKNMLFADYALDLIGEIQNQLHANSRADYEKGIAGIGVGIDYLMRHNFLDAEDDIFEDLDQRMYRAVIHDPLLNFSLYDGLMGYGRYWISRLDQQSLSVQAKECLVCIKERIEEKSPEIPQKEQTDVYCFLHDLHEISGFNVSNGLLEQYWKQSVNMNRRLSCLEDSNFGNILRMYQRNRYFNDTLQDEKDMSFRQIPDLDMKKPPIGTGLLTGYAGEGLLRLTVLDPVNLSWMQLL